MTHHQWPPWERGVHFNVMKMGIYRTAIRESLNGFPLSLSLGEPSVGHYALSAHLEGVPKVCWNIDIIRRGRTRPSNWGAVLPFSKLFSIDNDKLKKKSELPQLLGLGENKESIIDKRGIWTNAISVFMWFEALHGEVHVQTHDTRSVHSVQTKFTSLV